MKLLDNCGPLRGWRPAALAALSATALIGYESGALAQSAGDVLTIPNFAVSGIGAFGDTLVGQLATGCCGQGEAAVWTGSGGIQTLGYLGSSGGAQSYSTASAISANGAVVVGASAFNALGDDEAFRWTAAGGMQGLGFLGKTARGVEVSAAAATNSDGSVIVGSSLVSSGYYWAFRWTAQTGMTALGALPGSTTGYSQASGVSADGSVVVGQASAARGNTEAFRWTQPAGMTGLGFLSSYGLRDYSIASAVSADGATVVGYSTSPNASYNGYEAFRWTQSGGIQGLGFIGGGGPGLSTSMATAVSANGAVIVGASSSPTAMNEAFRWTQATGMQSLGGLLTAAGVNLNGWTLTGASAVSANGEFIAGSLPVNPITFAPASYLARYVDGSVVAGVTTPASVQISVDQIERAHLRLMAQRHGLAAELLGENNGLGAGGSLGLFGAVGSAEGGAVGEIADKSGLALLGGVAFETDRGDGYSAQAPLAAAAVRYVYDSGAALKPFGEIGGWLSPNMALSFSRAYANGAGVATGAAKTTGMADYGFLRGGFAYRADRDDLAAFSLELGGERLETGGYAEALSPPNPFPASFAGADAGLTLGKARVEWTHRFSETVDATAWGAAAYAFGASSNLTANVLPLGTLTPSAVGRPVWLEYGARVAYRFSPRGSVGVFVDGVAGNSWAGSEAHAGVDVRWLF
jgi:probable HAF family extracellular repeat protein